MSRVRLARKQRGETLIQVAARCQLSLGRLSMIERGMVQARAEEQQRIAQALEVDVRELFNGAR
jgi:transcriptional regulator with XRE-family HTH domain